MENILCVILSRFCGRQRPRRNTKLTKHISRMAILNMQFRIHPFINSSETELCSFLLKKCHIYPIIPPYKSVWLKRSLQTGKRQRLNGFLSGHLCKDTSLSSTTYCLVEHFLRLWNYTNLSQMPALGFVPNYHTQNYKWPFNVFSLMDIYIIGHDLYGYRMENGSTRMFTGLWLFLVLESPGCILMLENEKD